MSGLTLLIAGLLSLPLAHSAPLAPNAMAADAGCALCDHNGHVECATCDGKGQVRLACPGCDATGRVACRVCDPAARPAKPRITSAEAEKLAPELERLRKALEEAMGSMPKSKEKIALGRVDCHNFYCRSGKMQWRGGDADPCKLCGSKGTFACFAGCSKGKLQCDHCAGKKRVLSTCTSCGGPGKVSCPGCQVDPDGKLCPFCQSSRTHQCALCKQSDHGKGTCATCTGKGKVACFACRGSTRLPCKSCGSSGKIRVRNIYVGTGGTGKGGRRSCDPCDGRGYQRCTKCKSGKLSCETCDGAKRVVLPCPFKDHVPCTCKLEGDHAPWDALGDVLATEATLQPRAVEFYSTAMLRLQQDHERSAKDRKKAESRLQKKIKKHEPKDPPPPR